MDKVVHFEVPFDNKDRVMDFYKKVFDWNFQDISDMKYVTVHTVDVDEKQMPKESGVINGGMYNRNDGGSKNPVIVIKVDDIDKKLTQIQEAGGEIFMIKRKVGEMGFYAQVKDAERNIIGVWQDLILHKSHNK